MKKIKEVKVGPMPESNFLKPLRMTFTQNGRHRFWDFVKLHESVACILFNSSRQVLLFVKQFRPAVFYGNSVPATGDNSVPEVNWSEIPASNGITLELCAGIVDEHTLTLKEIMKKEILEECGYDVPLQNIESIRSYRSGIGVSGDKQNLFYAEVTDGMKVHDGGGLEDEGELIDVVEMTIPQMQEYITQDQVPSPGGFLYGMYWFLAHKAPKK